MNVATATGSMTSVEAAGALGVSTRQIQRFVEAGTLSSAGVIGRSLLIDVNSVARLASNGVQRGRPWNERTVWVALEMLGMRQSAEMTPSQRSHLRSRLRGMTAAELVRLARRRATVRRYRVSDSFLSALRKELRLTGRSALEEVPGLAGNFGLAGVARAGVDGYIDARRVNDVVADYLMVDDDNGNVTLRVVESPAGARSGHADLATVALDLAESLYPRERSAGRRVLAGLLSTV